MKLDLKEIGGAWLNLAAGSEEIKALANERMDVCLKCPFKEKQFGIVHCSLCMCPLTAKTHSPKNSCPKLNWKR